MVKPCGCQAHPGVNNSFLVTTGDPLALKYNDISPLENMHVATVFDVASRPKHDVFASLTPDAKREVRVNPVAAVAGMTLDMTVCCNQRPERRLFT